jgi:hypothetical protein
MALDKVCDEALISIPFAWKECDVVPASTCHDTVNPTLVMFVTVIPVGVIGDVVRFRFADGVCFPPFEMAMTFTAYVTPGRRPEKCTPDPVTVAIISSPERPDISNVSCQS